MGVEYGEGDLMIPFDPLLAPAVLVASRRARTRMAGFGAWVCGNVYVAVMFAFYWVTAGVGMLNARKMFPKLNEIEPFTQE